MKKNHFNIFVLVLAFIFFGSCAEAKNPESMPNNQNQTNYQITFIELGSVKCVPCRMMRPIMDEIEKEYAGIVKVVFHDVWTQEGRPMAVKYKVRAIPTQVFLDKDGKEIFRHVGFFPKEELVKFLESEDIKPNK